MERKREIKVTIIGGSGFVGTSVCRLLHKKKITFEIIDLKKSKSFPDNWKFGDVRDFRSLRNKSNGNLILNLAAVHRDDVFNKDEYYSTNVLGAKNVVKLCKEQKTRKLIFTSSVAVYGFSKAIIDEDSKIMPINDYGKSKYLAENVYRDWQEEEKNYNSLTIIRPTVIFGEGNRGNVYKLFKFISSKKFIMIGNGKNIKSVCYIENFSEFLHSCISKPMKGYKVLNYVDKPDFDMNTLVKKVKINLFKKQSLTFKLPYCFGMAIGYLGDFATFLTGKNYSVSSVRIKKFCSSTIFSSKMLAKEKHFSQPYTLEEAISRTIKNEFISPKPNSEIFYSE